MEGTLPGVPTDEDGERVVLHVDMDCFYASCERMREPRLRGEPVVVGMGYEAGETVGAVATASYEAREFGVESAQAISVALERLPRMANADADADDPNAPDPDEAGFYRPVDMEFYESVAAEVKEVLHDCADTVREVSIDEAYLDVTDRTAWTDAPDGDRTLAEGFARHVKDRIDREVGVVASVGVAPNMATAKVASDFDKPDGLTVVRPGGIESFLGPLPIEEVHGVGPVTARELADLGIETAGDLADADPAELTDRFGDRGRELYDRARGDDDREVTPTGRPKSLSRSSALSEPTDDRERKAKVVRALAADVAERARSRGALYRTIGIMAVTPPYDVNTRAESLSGPVDDPDLVREVALDLLGEFEDETVRKLGVRVSKLSFDAGEQATLGGYEGAETVDGESDGADAAGQGSPRRTDRSEGGQARTADPTLEEWVEETGTVDGEERSRDRRSRDGQVSLGDFE
ncbi:DNA polymerase Y family protein [Halorarum salinum]|uniref:DNA polymerase IV n=1 Tax=Halorarum salinum TaxID=2743089 RepID=A0A7D5LBU0_9EURY|nr:DNA polymerase IV [Halobaculum salinum]QLG62249.1 DNA polymerase IV [Halobaculum salinum]